MGENPYPCDIVKKSVHHKWAIYHSRYLPQWVKTHNHVTFVKWSVHQLEVFVLSVSVV